VRFGVFEFDQRTGELRKNGAKIKVEGQPIQVLELLLERPQQVVTQEEIRANSGRTVRWWSSSTASSRR